MPYTNKFLNLNYKKIIKLKNMKASDLFVKALENEWVEYIFWIPWEENLDLLNSLKDSKIKLIITRHEQAAWFMAATYWRLTWKAWVCLATLWPWATNLVTPSAYAQLWWMPMLMITWQKPIKKSKQWQFQIIDSVEMFKPITKFAKQIVDWRSIPSLIREAFRIAEEERPWSVHLELPEDIAREEIWEFHLFEKNKVYRPAAEEKAINLAVKMIEEAKHPLVLVWAWANRKLISKHLVKFLEKTWIPFVNTQMWKWIVSKAHKYYIWTAALSDGDYVHCAIKKADLIINIWHDVIEKPPFFMEWWWTKVIHVNFFWAKVDDIYFPQLEVIWDISNSLWQIAEKIIPQKTWNFEYFYKIQKSLQESRNKNIDNNKFPILPEKVVHDIRSVMPDDWIVTLDNWVYKIWFARNYICHEQWTLLLDNALATMWAGLPSAMAAKLIFPNKKIMAVCGDWWFMMNSQELETAIRLNLDLVILILNDNGYWMIKWKQENMWFENWWLDFGNPDFIKYAESYWAKWYRINKTEELKPLLDICLNTKWIHVIEVPVDYSENKDILKKLECIN